MTRRLVFCALLAVACGGEFSTAPLDVTAAQPNEPKRVAATTGPQGNVSKPNAEVAPRSVGSIATTTVASSDESAPTTSPGASADAGALAPLNDAGELRADAGPNAGDAAALLPLDCACKLDSDCASGWCRPTFAMCGDSTTLPLASGLLCASDDECASGHCDALYYDPAHQVSHNCR